MHHGDFQPETGLYWRLESKANDGLSINLLVVDIETPSIENTIYTINNLHAITFYYGE
jgi:hypothetical protein